MTMHAPQLYSCRASITLALALALCGLCQGVTVTPFNEDCPSPVPPPSQYNKLVPDLTVVPLPMSVSLQPIMVTDVSPRLQTFELTGYLFMSWTDRRLAFNASRCNRGKQRYVLTGDSMSRVWRPYLEFPNSKFRSIEPEEVNVWDTGFALWVGRIQLTLHANLNVMMFPFDEHDLDVTVEEFDHPTPELVLVPDVNNTAIDLFSSSQFVFDKQMKIVRHLFPVPQRQTTWDQVTFTFHARRMWASTFLGDIVPIFFIVGMAVFSFALPREHSTARVSICITAFLAAMAFSVTLQSSLPPVQYITRMNVFIVMSYSLNFCTFIAAVIVGAIKSVYDVEREAAAQAAKEAGVPAADVVNPLNAAIEMTAVGGTRRRAHTKSARQEVDDKLAASDGLAAVVIGSRIKAKRMRFAGLCQCCASDQPRHQRLKAWASSIDFCVRFLVMPTYMLVSYLLFQV